MKFFRSFLLPSLTVIFLIFSSYEAGAQELPEQAVPEEGTPVEKMQAKTVPVPPVPSAIKAESDGQRITLSWKPCQGQNTGAKILRHSKPITLSNYMEAEEAGITPKDIFSFTDSIETSGEFYYAVLPYDEKTGAQTTFFVPSGNSLVFPVEITVSEKLPGVQISLFDVILKNQAVIVSWTSSAGDKAVLLYRSTTPFESQTALTRATIIATLKGDDLPYVDYPVPGVPYYYAAVPEDTIRSGTASFKFGENTNEIPVEVPAEYAGLTPVRKATARAIPLPTLNLAEGTSGKNTVTFSENTEKIIASLNDFTSGNRKPRNSAQDTPYRFPEDYEASGGEESALKKILDDNFTDGQWDKLSSELSEFMNLRRTPEISARVHFYLGQAYFFTAEYGKALQEFLLSQELYYNKSREWIQRTMEKL